MANILGWMIGTAIKVVVWLAVVLVIMLALKALLIVWVVL